MKVFHTFRYDFITKKNSYCSKIAWRVWFWYVHHPHRVWPLNCSPLFKFSAATHRFHFLGFLLQSLFPPFFLFVCFSLYINNTCVRDVFLSESSLNGHHGNGACPLVSVLTLFHCILNAALSQVASDSHVIRRCEIWVTFYYSHKLLILQIINLTPPLTPLV